MGPGLSLRCLGQFLRRSLDTARRYARAWQDQAPRILSRFVQVLLEVRPDFPLPPAGRTDRVRPGRQPILDLAVWARLAEVVLVPQDGQPGELGWPAVNLLLQGIPHWL